jgi:endoglucanase
MSHQTKGNRNMKIRHVIVTALGALLLSGHLHASEGIVARHGRLSVRGTQVVDARGEPVVLAGMSFGWHNWWPKYWNADAVKWLRDDWKCTVLRAAMGVEPDSGYLRQPEFSGTLVRQVVDACIQNGIYVVIDWHDHNAHNHADAAMKFFTGMAGRYGKFPNVIYEIYNEPAEADWKTVKAYSEKVIAAIRAVDPDNLILVGSPHWDQDVHIAADDPITGFSNLLYTLHFYAGTHKAWLRERGDYALKKGLPIFVSEYGGCDASGDGPLDMNEWNLWMDWMDANGISWCAWSVSDKSESCSVLKPGAAASGGWSAEDLKESGRIARDLIRGVNANVFPQGGRK